MVDARTRAASWAADRVDAVRDSPAQRSELLIDTYRQMFGGHRRHRRFRRAALSFLEWQRSRGVLDPLAGSTPGSPWWRAINDRLLLDGCEAAAIASRGGTGPAPREELAPWLAFARRPTPSSWYRAHNASVVRGYLDNRALAQTENEPERFFLNVILLRVLFAHALVAQPRLALGWLGPAAPLLGDPRLGMTGMFLQLRRVMPPGYPLAMDVLAYRDQEHGFGRLLDYGVIVPRLRGLYRWSAHELGVPGLDDLLQDGIPAYAWDVTNREVWSTPATPLLTGVRRLLPTYANPAHSASANQPDQGQREQQETDTSEQA